MNVSEQAEIITDALGHYADGPGTVTATNNLLDFLEQVQQNPDEISNLYLAYIATDNPSCAEAEALLAKLGPNPTHGDLRKAIEAEQERIAGLIQ